MVEAGTPAFYPRPHDKRRPEARLGRGAGKAAGNRLGRRPALARRGQARQRGATRDQVVVHALARRLGVVIAEGIEDAAVLGQ